MMTRIAFFGLALSAMLLVTACGRAPTSSVKSGSNVNNGPGPVGDILVCDGLDDATIKLTIRHTAAVTLIQGLLQMGDQYFSLECDAAYGSQRSGGDAPQALWNCLDTLPGEAYRATVHTQGLSALKTSGSYDRSKSVG